MVEPPVALDRTRAPSRRCRGRSNSLDVMPPAAPSWHFTLGLRGFDATGSARVHSLLTFARSQLRAAWDIVSASSGADVLLIDHAAPPPAADGAPRPRFTVYLADPGEPLPPGEALHKPLQYEDFAKLLAHLEWTLIGLASLSDAAAPATPSALSRPTAPAASRPKDEDPGRDRAYRLRRWPPASVLAADRYHPRLASFLSTRAMGLEELGRLSGASTEHCRSFLALVQPLGIVETIERGAAPKRPPGSAEPAKKTGAQGQSHGLIALIRQHLGIGWSN